jgi:hypothetical protein
MSEAQDRLEKEILRALEEGERLCTCGWMLMRLYAQAKVEGDLTSHQASVLAIGLMHLLAKKWGSSATAKLVFDICGV